MYSFDCTAIFQTYFNSPPFRHKFPPQISLILLYTRSPLFQSSDYAHKTKRIQSQIFYLPIVNGSSSSYRYLDPTKKRNFTIYNNFRLYSTSMKILMHSTFSFMWPSSKENNNNFNTMMKKKSLLQSQYLCTPWHPLLFLAWRYCSPSLIHITYATHTQSLINILFNAYICMKWYEGLNLSTNQETSSQRIMLSSGNDHNGDT